jgi:hypothetical protein
MEPPCSYKTSADFQQTTRRYIPEYIILSNKDVSNVF